MFGFFRKKYNGVEALMHYYNGKKHSIYITTDNYKVRGTTLYVPGKIVENVFYIKEMWYDDVIREYKVQ